MLSAKESEDLPPVCSVLAVTLKAGTNFMFEPSGAHIFRGSVTASVCETHDQFRNISDVYLVVLLRT
jgi:hypothetical protein